MRHTYWKSGDWNAICDSCGFKFKGSDLKQRWDGVMVCQGCWETRHPQELMKPFKDVIAIPWSRPEGQDQFISRCTVNGRQGIAGIGTAGCAIVGLNLGGDTTVI